MSPHRTLIPESLKTASRDVFHAETTATADYKGILPAKSDVIYVTCLVTMANAASLVLTLYTADDADGTTPVALTENVPIYVDDVAQTAAKTHTITDDTGNFVVVFCVPSLIVPTDKYLCIHYANSNAANILSVLMIEDTIYNG